MKPTLGTLDPEDVRRLHDEGLGVIAIARKLRRRNDLIVSCLRDLGLNDRVTKEWLVEQYVTLARDARDIAAERGVTEAAVQRHLRRFGIPIRYRSRGAVRNRLLADPDWLREMYWTRGLSMRRMALDAGCTVTSVRVAMVKFGIERRRQTMGIGIKNMPEHELLHFRPAVRRIILERDHHACRWPDCGSTVRLEINHIVPVHRGGDCSPENGITLCRVHHQGITGRELEFAPLFRELVSLGPLT